jgi:hypothetical protein
MDISASSYISLYQQGVQLVAHVLKQHSPPSDKDAVGLAVHVLHAIDHIPGKVRRSVCSLVQPCAQLLQSVPDGDALLNEWAIAIAEHDTV